MDLKAFAHHTISNTNTTSHCVNHVHWLRNLCPSFKFSEQVWFSVISVLLSAHQTEELKFWHRTENDRDNFTAPLSEVKTLFALDAFSGLDGLNIFLFYLEVRVLQNHPHCLMTPFCLVLWILATKCISLRVKGFSAYQFPIGWRIKNKRNLSNMGLVCIVFGVELHHKNQTSVWILFDSFAFV